MSLCKVCGEKLNTGLYCEKCGADNRSNVLTGGRRPFLINMEITEEYMVEELKKMGYVVIKGGDIK